MEKRKRCPRLAAPWSATHMSSEILPCLFCDDANASLNTPSSKWSVRGGVERSVIGQKLDINIKATCLLQLLKAMKS